MNTNILVVEDNPDNMKLVGWALEDAGYSFAGARSAEEALNLLEQRVFDLVLMDVSLPGMDGTEATRRLRADPRFATLPIIAVTAHAIRTEEEAILASGVDDLVTKPIDETRLLQAIETMLPSSTEKDT
jgi:CheY-like chemotaxis protein